MHRMSIADVRRLLLTVSRRQRRKNSGRRQLIAIPEVLCSVALRTERARDNFINAMAKTSDNFINMVDISASDSFSCVMNAAKVHFKRYI